MTGFLRAQYFILASVLILGSANSVQALPELHGLANNSTAANAGAVYDIYQQHGINVALVRADIAALGTAPAAGRDAAAKKLLVDLRNALPISWNGTKTTVDRAVLDADLRVLFAWPGIGTNTRNALNNAVVSMQNDWDRLATDNGVDKREVFDLMSGIRNHMATGGVVDAAGNLDPANAASLTALENIAAKLNKNIGRDVTGNKNQFVRADLVAKLLDLAGINADPAKPEGKLVDYYLNSQNKVLEKLPGFAQADLQGGPPGDSSRYQMANWNQALKNDLSRADVIAKKPAATRTHDEQRELAEIGRRVKASGKPATGVTDPQMKEQIRRLGFDATPALEQTLEAGKAYGEGNKAQSDVMVAGGKTVADLVNAVKGTSTDVTPKSYIESIIKFQKPPTTAAAFNEVFDKLSSMSKETFLHSLGLSSNPSEATWAKAGEFVDAIHKMQTAKLAAASPATLDGLKTMLEKGPETIERVAADWAMDRALEEGKYPVAKAMLGDAAARAAGEKLVEKSDIDLMKMEGELHKLMGRDGGTINFDEMATKLHELQLAPGYDRTKMDAVLAKLHEISTKPLPEPSGAMDAASRSARDNQMAEKVAADLMMRRLINLGAKDYPSLANWQEEHRTPKWATEGDDLGRKKSTAEGDDLIKLVNGRGKNELGVFNTAAYKKYMAKYNGQPNPSTGYPQGAGPSTTGSSTGGGGAAPVTTGAGGLTGAPMAGTPGSSGLPPEFDVSRGAYSVNYPNGMVYAGQYYPPGNYYLPQSYVSNGGANFNYYPNYNTGGGVTYAYPGFDASAFQQQYQQPTYYYQPPRRRGFFGGLFGGLFGGGG
jgi:hypothetical protein